MMLRIQRIASYMCIFQVIFQHYGSLAATVSINQNITGLLGQKDTNLTCSIFLEQGEKILSLQIIAKNITEDFDDKNRIATFEPAKVAKLLPSGAYLSDRVTLTNITTISTNATLTFHGLKCIDEKEYMCKLFYLDNDGLITEQESEATSISVKVQVRDVHIKNEPNQKQYDEKTDNITLTCEANGNPEPSYIWFKENSNRSILSTTDLYVIKDVIRNNSGVYICQAYNIINNIAYKHSYSVVIDIVDKLPSESVSSKISAGQAAYAALPVLAIGLIVFCFALRKHFSKQSIKEKSKERRCDGYTKKQEYIPVSSNNNTNPVGSGDASNGLSENKISYRNKEVGLVKTVDIIQRMPTASVNIYADPKDTLPREIVKDREKYDDNGASDQSAVYAEVIDQGNMDYEMSNSQKSVTP